MNKKKKKKGKKGKEDRKVHPMWLLIFLMLGLTLSIMLTTYEPTLILSIVGVIAMLSFTSTPSQDAKFGKTNLQSVLVWVCVVIITLMLTIVLLQELEVIDLA